MDSRCIPAGLSAGRRRTENVRRKHLIGRVPSATAAAADRFNLNKCPMEPERDNLLNHPDIRNSSQRTAPPVRL